jgi:thiol-disulfide isomerase/thioredoxin
VLKWEGVQELVAQKQGSIVVVDIWATYCPPCVAEFPNLVKLHGKYGERVACISVSADFDGLDDKPAEAHREKVLAFLTKHGARFDNVLLATDAEALFSEKIPQQSLPVVYVYDRQGKLAGQFPDPANPSEFTYAEHITPLVEKLLADQ